MSIKNEQCAWRIGNRIGASGCNGIVALSTCACGGEMLASIGVFSRSAEARCEQCKCTKTVPPAVLAKAQAKRSTELDEAARIRVQHGGSGLWIPE